MIETGGLEVNDSSELTVIKEERVTTL